MSKKTGNERIMVYVAGVTYGVRQKVLKKYFLRYTLGKRTKVSLKRDRKNKHDKYAVKVFFGKREVGWIPRKVSKLVSRAIKDRMIKKVKLHDIHCDELKIYSASIMLIF